MMNTVSKDYVIETQNLTCCFGSFTAVDRLNLKISRGSIYGFIGPNGCGKSTTIRMLCSILRPTAGIATVLGYDTAKDVNDIKQHIGYMSQKFSLYHDLTAIENLNFYAGLYSLTKQEQRQRIPELLSLLHLDYKEHALAATLSGGTRQRLALGCAILHRPEILFLDEPTSAVDPTSRRLFWNVIYELSHQGTTILVTTHFMDEAEHCDEAGFLRAGRLIAQGTPAALKRSINGQLITMDSTTPLEALARLKASGISYLDAYIFGKKLHVILSPNADTTKLDNYQKAEPTMEDVFVYYDKHEEITEKKEAMKI